MYVSVSNKSGYNTVVIPLAVRRPKHIIIYHRLQRLGKTVYRYKTRYEHYE